MSQDIGWQAAWGQAGGPDGSWQVAGRAATTWSVARYENICYRTKLPGGGQGGIAVHGDRLFLTTFRPVQGDSRMARDILGHAVDANTGEILWTVELSGSVDSPMMYGFSDSTSWTPITDGEHVWFYNASGQMGAWDMDGNEVWKRNFLLQTGRPFNKQFEPFMVGNVVVNMEAIAPGEAGYIAAQDGWNHLRGINKLTGEIEWTSRSTLTHYSTPVYGKLEGRPAVMFGRGGPHGVPERPVGLSLMSLDPADAGTDIWSTEADNSEGLYTQVWDDQHAYWFSKGADASHLVFDIRTGELRKTQSLQAGIDVRQWNKEKGDYDLKSNVHISDVPDTVFGGKMNAYPNWSSNLVAAGYHYFSTHTNNKRNKVAGTHGGPAFSLGRVNIDTGKVEYLEVPVGVRPDGTRVYGENLTTRVEDNEGNNLAAEDRSKQHGWTGPSFFGTPTVVGDVIYMTAMLGVTYVVQADAETLDASALLAVNDLGPLGDTWSLNSISYSRGRLYHRTAKELICIEAPALEPLVSRKGELLFEDRFTEPEPKPEWRALHGTRWEIADGVFLGIPSTREFQASRDNHTGATPSMFLHVPARDSILEMSVRISGGLDAAHIGFNEGPTQTTSGHIFRLILDVNKGVFLQRDRHSQIAGDAHEILDESDWKPTRDSWITVLIETQGEEVVAQIEGGPSLRMRAARLNVPKESGNLKARGDEGSIEYDNVRIWAALPLLEPETRTP